MLSFCCFRSSSACLYSPRNSLLAAAGIPAECASMTAASIRRSRRSDPQWTGWRNVCLAPCSDILPANPAGNFCPVPKRRERRGSTRIARRKTVKSRNGALAVLKVGFKSRAMRLLHVLLSVLGIFHRLFLRSAPALHALLAKVGIFHDLNTLILIWRGRFFLL